MMKYELKKVLLKRSSKIALFLLLVIVGITCYLAADVSYVDSNGKTNKGPAAVASLKAAQKVWAGYLDEDQLRKVIAENRRIAESPEYASDRLQDREIAYSWGQGIEEIRNLLNDHYAEGFQDYDYYRANSLTESDAADFYKNRIRLLKEWLAEEAKDQFSDAEKAYLICQYEKLRTPFYVDYRKGWRQLFEYAPTVVMAAMLILGYLVAGIFSNEFLWKSDAVFFSTAYGRNRAVRDKIKAGFCLVTGVYFAAFLLYSSVVLFYLGTDGSGLAVQAEASSWKCFYPITLWQEYLIIAAGGYIGCLFISFLSMLVSAKTKSAVLAVMVPFLLIFLPSFLSNINSPAVNRVIGLLPDQLLQMGAAVKYFNLYEIGGKVVGAVPILMTLYAFLTMVLLPIIYRVYCCKRM